jgi:hypothetical protein
MPTSASPQATSDRRRLFRYHSYGLQPRFDQLGSCRCWVCGTPQAKGVSSLRIEVHLDGHAGLLEGEVVADRVLRGIDGVIFILEQEGGWCFAGDMRSDFGIQRDAIDSTIYSTALASRTARNGAASRPRTPTGNHPRPTS